MNREKNSGLERVILMGLLPLLGGTVDLQAAVLMAGGCLIVALLVQVVAIIVDHIGVSLQEVRWLFLFGVGLTGSYIVFLVLPMVVPIYMPVLELYVILLGVTPIVYVGAVEEANWTSFIRTMVAFVVLILTTGFAREILGRGTLMGMTLLTEGFAPVALMAEPPGAFISLGGIWLAVRGVLYWLPADDRLKIRAERRELLE